jgi:hypothetical protein
VVVGFSFREAEEYVEICEQILEVRLHYHVLLCSRYGVAQQCRIMDYVCSRVAKVDLSTGEACSNHCG